VAEGEEEAVAEERGERGQVREPHHPRSLARGSREAAGAGVLVAASPRRLERVKRS
jgi:hypothetical protein